jgi:hypothetical protein
MGSQVPSPKSQIPINPQVNKSQHGGEVPSFEPREPNKVWLLWDVDYYKQQKSRDLCCEWI